MAEDRIRVRARRSGRVRRGAAAVWLTALTAAGCASTMPQATSRVRVVSQPPGALVTLIPDDPGDHRRVVVGITPVDAEITFAAGGSAKLVVEKRGFDPVAMALEAASAPVSVELEPSGDPTSLERAVIGAAVLVLAGPEIEVIRRGFSHEAVSVGDSTAASDALAAAIAARLAGLVEVRRLGAAEVTAALERDAGAAVVLLDPVRLPFLTRAPRLETAAGRAAAAAAGEFGGARPVLLVSGRSSVETGGMKAGKLGIMVAGTAASYGAGYGQALASGRDSFIYTVYLPAATGGTRLDAILIDAASGEVLWLNRGLYPPLDPDRPQRTRQIVDDLLTGFPLGAPAIQP